MNPHRINKTQRLLKYMLEGNSVTGRQALRQFGIYRLSSTIHNWRKRGFDINTKMVEGPDYTHAEYKLIDTP